MTDRNFQIDNFPAVGTAKSDVPIELLAAMRIINRKKQSFRPPWREVARAGQIAPPHPPRLGAPDPDCPAWFIWLIMAGRGWGKTRTGGERAAEWGREYPGIRVALVAATFADGRDTMVEGESGLLSIFNAQELRGGSIDAAWNRSLGELFLANGSRYKVFSSEKPRQLRGPQHHCAWGDEPAFWQDADDGTAKDTTFTNLRIGTRLPPIKTWPKTFHSEIVLTTTPKPCALLKSRNPSAPGLLDDPNVIITRGTTQENIDNLSDSYKATVIAPLEGTRLGRQELYGNLLEDVEGALWESSVIDAARVPTVPRGVTFKRVVVAVDPATTSGEDSDDTGIIVAALGSDGDGYVLADRTCHLSPDGWAKAAIKAYKTFEADRVVAETNNGGDMVALTLRTVDPRVPFKKVTATRGKRVRAEPVAAKYEQGKIHHVGVFPELEDEMCSFTVDSSTSPNRMDALVWALTELMLGSSKRFRPAGKEWAA